MSSDPAGHAVEPGSTRRVPADQVVRAALARARAAARAKGLRPGQRPVAPTDRPEARDPQLIGTSVMGLATDLGWDDDIVVGRLSARWSQVVGDEVAQHCEFVGLDGGVLTVRASSTAWATQLGLMTQALISRCEDEIGQGHVVQVTVLGPVGRGFGRGRLRVQGRGPRDTWG